MTSATSTNTLGFILWTLAVAVVLWASTIGERWWKLKRAKAASPFRQALVNSLWPGLVGTLVLVLVTYGFFIVRTVYDDHESLVKATVELRELNATQEDQIRNNKHFLDILQAFTVYRMRINVRDYSSCLIKTTTPSETQSLASMVSHLANLATQCQTYGPMDANMSPEVREETEKGMVDGIIIFHARKGDNEADELFGILGSTLPLRRSYEVPPNIPIHFLWLQYGMNIKWNSER
jgi:hypothetical protein